MPIVVRELVIRARVEEAAGVSAGNRPPHPSADASGMRDAEIQRIVALCVEQVMERLEREKER